MSPPQQPSPEAFPLQHGHAYHSVERRFALPAREWPALASVIASKLIEWSAASGAAAAGTTAAQLRRDGAPEELTRQLWRSASGGGRDEMS